LAVGSRNEDAGNDSQDIEKHVASRLLLRKISWEEWDGENLCIVAGNMGE
jgi:hypothetical protein